VDPSDEALCRRVADGDQGAFDLLVSRYQQRAWRLARSILRDAEEARDISQEAFVRLFQSAGRFDGRSKFSTWFYRILVNLCLDQRRRQRWWQRVGPRPNVDEPDEGVERYPAPPDDPLDGLGTEQDVKRLWAAVETLSPQQRAAVVLMAREEMPTREIATVLKCSEATVRVHLHRALASLRRILGAELR
jgi:RNA polymerase sigma-70 factor (ECF subfamily)